VGRRSEVRSQSRDSGFHPVKVGCHQDQSAPHTLDAPEKKVDEFVMKGEFNGSAVSLVTADVERCMSIKPV
jgi:hypothetical protein